MPVTPGSGSIEEVLVLSLEVPDHDEDHGALRRSEASFSSAFDDSPIGMAITAPAPLSAREQCVLRVDETLARELHQGSLSEVMHPDDIESNDALIGQTLAGEKRTAMIERRYLCLDDSVVHAVTSITLDQG